MLRHRNPSPRPARARRRLRCRRIRRRRDRRASCEGRRGCCGLGAQATRPARRQSAANASPRYCAGRCAGRRLGGRAVQERRHMMLDNIRDDGGGHARRSREQPVAHLVYISSDAVYADWPLPLTRNVAGRADTACTARCILRARRCFRSGRQRAARDPAPDAGLRRRRSAQRLRPEPISPPGQSRRSRSSCSARARSGAIMSTSTTSPRLVRARARPPLGGILNIATAP